MCIQQCSVLIHVITLYYVTLSIQTYFKSQYEQIIIINGVTEYHAPDNRLNLCVAAKIKYQPIQFIPLLNLTDIVQTVRVSTKPKQSNRTHICHSSKWAIIY